MHVLLSIIFEFHNYLNYLRWHFISKCTTNHMFFFVFFSRAWGRGYYLELMFRCSTVLYIHVSQGLDIYGSKCTSSDCSCSTTKSPVSKTQALSPHHVGWWRQNVVMNTCSLYHEYSEIWLILPVDALFLVYIFVYILRYNPVFKV